MVGRSASKRGAVAGRATDLTAVQDRCLNGNGTSGELLAPFVQGDMATAVLPDLSLVIPTYWQADVIQAQVADVLAELDSLDLRYEVLVVVDGDDDRTATELSALEHEHLRIAVLARNAGKGNAVRRGSLSLGGRARAFLDGGGDIPARCLLDAYDVFQRSKADIVVGSKLHPNSAVEYAPLRRVYSWGYRQLTRRMFGLNVRDTQAGLKIYSAAVVEQVFPHVRTRGFAFDIEALALAWRLGFHRIVESPVVIRDRFATTIRTAHVLGIFAETLLAWWRLRRFGPDKHGSYRTQTD